jgi:hypothetical protein
VTAFHNAEPPPEVRRSAPQPECRGNRRRARRPSAGDVIFIRWIAHGTGLDQPSGFSGVDRILLENGKVRENRIYFDPARFHSLLANA